MKSIYLSNGQKANLIKKFDEENFFVELLMDYQDEFGDYQEIEGDRILVHKIFKTAPVPNLDNHYKDQEEKYNELTNRLSKTRTELAKANDELSKIQKQKTELNKFIINRAELRRAESIFGFLSGSINPTNLTPKRHGKIKFEIDVYTGDERRWIYKMFEDGAYDYGSYLDDRYDLMIDLSEEEIVLKAKERAIIHFSNKESEIKRASDKYLPESLLGKKRDLLKIEKDKEQAGIQAEIEKHQKRLSSLL